MTRPARLFVVALAAMIVAGGLRAAAAPTPGKAYVVVVGVGAYTDPGIKPRPHAEDDAKALYDLLTNKEYLDVNPEQVKLLLGSKDDRRPHQTATRDHILEALSWAAAGAGKDDLVVIAFFGQASPTALFGCDVVLKDRDRTALGAGALDKALEGLRSDRYLALLDVSFKGYDEDRTPASAATAAALGKFLLGAGEKDDAPSPTGRLAILATSNGRTSVDMDKHGLFAAALLQALKGLADKEGYEADGVVSACEIVQFLERLVPELAKTYGITREDKEQTPLVVGCRASDFAVTSNPAAAAKAQERLERFATLAEDRKLAPAVAEEGRRLLRQMPCLAGEQELRKLYQKLADGGLAVADFQKSRDKQVAENQVLKADAAAFATKVMQGIRVLHHGYVRDTNLGEMVAWVCQGLCQRPNDRRIPADLKDRLDKSSKLKEADLTALLHDVRERLGTRGDLAGNRDVDQALSLVTRKLDAHTSYISAATLAEFKRLMTGNYTGIGVRIGKDNTRDMLKVLTPVKGSPAYNAGIRAGDIITTITREVDNNGKKLPRPEVLSTKGLPVGEAMSRVLGTPGTDIKLTVERPGADRPVELTITRGDVSEETVFGVKRLANDDWDHMLDAEHKIGYIRLAQFAENSTRDMRKAVESLKKQGVRGMVLDLRFNPGGYLQSAVDVSGLFIDDGLVVSIRPRVGEENKYYGDLKGGAQDFPMVCLINSGSASASEVVSACLQDHQRALIVGERSYGKGSVQNIVDFKPTGGQLKYTSATFWRPNGKNLNRASTKGTEAEDWGVIPDKGYVVRLSGREREELLRWHNDQEIIHRAGAPDAAGKVFHTDKQLQAGLEYLRGQIKVARKAG